MKKSVFAILLALMLVVSSSALAMTAGTYEAEAQGMMGMVKVAVTVSETAIEKVEVVAQRFVIKNNDFHVFLPFFNFITPRGVCQILLREVD